MLIHELILNSANRYADSPALLLANKSLSYGELWEQVQSVGNGLNRLGVRRSDRIGIYLNKRFEGVVSYFAASYAGAVFVPINPALKPRQVGHILRDCNVSVLITSQASYSNLQSELPECSDLKFVVTIGGDAKATDGQYSRLSWEELLATDPAAAQLPRCIDHDIASILYTSGSTGKPKGVLHTAPISAPKTSRSPGSNPSRPSRCAARRRTRAMPANTMGTPRSTPPEYASRPVPSSQSNPGNPWV